MKKIKFGLAGLIHEKILGRKPAQTIGEKIAAETNEWNYKYGNDHCFECGCKQLTSDIRGSNGIFTWTSKVYRCTQCGNVQEDLNKHKFLFRELEEKKLVEDGIGQYRYIILTPEQILIIILLAIAATPAYFIIRILYKILKAFSD